MTEIEAKVKYVKLARSLQTYGVSFFLVKVRAKTVQFYTSKECSQMYCIHWIHKGSGQYAHIPTKTCISAIKG